MQSIILLIHIIVGVLFILLVLMQDKGVGFGGAIGGTGGGSGFYSTQRGAAKVIHKMTVFFCILFFLTALAYVVVPSGPLPAALSPVSAPADVPAPPTPVEVTVGATESGLLDVETVPAGE